MAHGRRICQQSPAFLSRLHTHEQDHINITDTIGLGKSLRRRLVFPNWASYLRSADDERETCLVLEDRALIMFYSNLMTFDIAAWSAYATFTPSNVASLLGNLTLYMIWSCVVSGLGPN